MPPGAFIVDLRRSVRSISDLANIVGSQEELVQRAIRDDEELFQLHRIPKRNGGFREVWEVKDEALADAMKSFDSRFRGFASTTINCPHPNCHGYVEGRSIRTNAEQHLRARLLLRADIREFFPTIKTGRVESAMLGWGLSDEGAKAVARFVTFRGFLPLGFAPSPAIANAICFELDEALTKLGAQYQCAYTRYSDDITFSGQVGLPSRIEISSILETHGFELNRRKFRIKLRGQSFYVTGLSVSAHDRPRAPRALKRGLRQELYFAKKLGLEKHLGTKDYSSFQSGINKIDGRLRFLNAIEPALAKKMLAEWEEILDKAGMKAAQAPRRERPPRSVDIFFDESIIESSKGHIMFLGCVVTENGDAIRARLEDLLEQSIADPYAPGRKEALKKKGLHWVDVHEETRTMIVKTISSLPFRMYANYCSYPPAADFANTYFDLLLPMLRPRLIALDGCSISISFEEQPQLKIAALTAAVKKAYDELAATNSRRPRILPTVSIVSKRKEPCLTLVDAMLAVLGEAAMSQPQPPVDDYKRKTPGEQARVRFERLRAKYRLIRSQVTSEVFTRRYTFEPWPNGDPTVHQSKGRRLS